MKIAIALVSLLVLVLAGYFFLASDKGLLDQNYAMRTASGVLGDNLYGETCKRDQYVDKVQTLENRSSFVFGFTPKPGVEDRCVFTKVIVDRKTGEAWVDKKK